MRITSYEVKATARTLAKRPAFTAVAVLSLALAIGVNTTMYSTLDALLNPTIAMREPERLQRIAFYGDFRHKFDARARNEMLRSGVDGFEALTGQWFAYSSSLLESAKAHRTGDVINVAPNYFAVLGVHAMAGRLLTDADVGATPPPVVIGERAARDLFPKRDPLGQSVEIQGETHVVIGVIDRASDFPLSRTAAWRLPPGDVDIASLPLNLVRLRPGVLQENVKATLQVIANRIALETGESKRDNRVAMAGFVGGQFRMGGFHLALIGAVIAVLLVACANIANLQLARGIARSRELATRAALGASRRDIILHLVLESGMVAGAGLLLGLLLTFWGMHAIRASIPTNIGEFLVEPQTSWRLFAFAAVATAVCVLLVGLAPAIRVSRVNLNDLIKSGAGTGSTRSARQQYGLLIVAEIGFALVVLCGAALLVRASYRLEVSSRAFDQSMLAGALTRVELPAGQSVPFADIAAELVARARMIPDAADAAVVLRVSDNDRVVSATDPGGAIHTVPAPQWGYSVASPSLLGTMGFEIAHGRDFREGEVGAVAIIDPQTARLLWPNTEAVGHMIKFGAPHRPGRWYTVIGVRKPVGLESTAGTPTSPGSIFVLPVDENRLNGSAIAVKRPAVDVIVRARRNTHRIPVFIKSAFANDSRLAVYFAGTFDERSSVATRRENQRFVGVLFSLFAALSLALAALGVYGIVSHSVAERRREIGVRLALGSSRRNILRAVLREGNVFVLGGIALGLVLIRQNAWLLTQFLGSFPEIDVYSIELYVPAAIFFFIVALISALVPALRATRIDPVEALRCE